MIPTTRPALLPVSAPIGADEGRSRSSASARGEPPGLISGSATGTPFTPPALRSYRTRHTVQPVRDWNDDFRTFTNVCSTDGIRVYRERGRWRHDPSEIRQLAALERGEKVPW